jgi:lysophospholipid acyltransferase
MEAIDGAFVALHEMMGGGIPLDQLKFLICQLSVIPLGVLVTMTPPSWTDARHWICIVISIFLMTVSINEWCFLHSLFTSSVAYVMVWLLPRESSPLCVFVFAMGYMSVSHIYRMWTDWGGWHIDFTAAQMIVTLKLISFAFCCADGSRQDHTQKLSKYQLEHRITRFPLPLEFFAYIYFFPSFLCGPPIEFSDYLKWADYSMFPEKKVPRTFLPAIKQMFLSFLFLIPVFISLNYPPSLLFSEEFAALNFFVRMGVAVLLLSIFRCKYYMLWWLAEAGYIACGFAYTSEKNGEIDWTRTKNVYPLLCEFGGNVQTRTRGWNIKVSDWLKYYVYLRVLPSDSKGIPMYVTLATYGVSAIWHGFYPGYYLFFLTFAIMDQLGRLIKDHIRPHFLPEDSIQKKFYDAVCVILVSAMANYIGLSFVILDVAACFTWWADQFFWGHILTFGSFVTLLVYAKTLPRKKVE